MNEMKVIHLTLDIQQNKQTTTKILERIYKCNIF